MTLLLILLNQHLLRIKFLNAQQILGFVEHLKILSEEGVDLIVLEAMSSQADIVETIIECSQKTNLPVWLSISCVMNAKNDKVMLGYSDSIDTDTHIYESLDVAIKNFSKLHKGPISVSYTHLRAHETR